MFSKYLFPAITFMSGQIDAKCPFGHDSQGANSAVNLAEAFDASPDIGYPSDIMTCPADGVQKTPPHFSQDEYKDIVKDVVAAYEKLPHHSETNEKEPPRAAFAGCVVRLAGHDFMDFRWDRSARHAKNGGFWSYPWL